MSQFYFIALFSLGCQILHLSLALMLLTAALP